MSQKKIEEPVEPPKKSKFKLILIIIILLLLLGGGAATFWWFQMRTPNTIVPAPQTQVDATNVGNAPVSTAGTNVQKQNNSATTTIPNVNTTSNTSATSSSSAQNVATNITNIPAVTVNLSDTDPIRYLRVSMDVELSTAEAVDEIKAQNAKIRDSIIILLSGKTYRELASARGKLEVKNEVASRINQILGSPRVVRIYFTEFVIQ